jgi:hypothetical protein
VIDSIIVALCCMNQGWTAGGYCISFSSDASTYGPVEALTAFADCDGPWYLPGLPTNRERLFPVVCATSLQRTGFYSNHIVSTGLFLHLYGRA